MVTAVIARYRLPAGASRRRQPDGVAAPGGAPRGRPRTPCAPGWLATTARRECLQVIRLRGRETPVDPQGTTMGGASESPETDEDLLREERAQVLRAALLELSPPRRELLMLLMADPPSPTTRSVRSWASPSAASAPPGPAPSRQAAQHPGGHGAFDVLTVAGSPGWLRPRAPGPRALQGGLPICLRIQRDPGFLDRAHVFVIEDRWGDVVGGYLVDTRPPLRTLVRLPEAAAGELWRPSPWRA